jgi:hypothetical protein
MGAARRSRDPSTQPEDGWEGSGAELIVRGV